MGKLPDTFGVQESYNTIIEKFIKNVIAAQKEIENREGVEHAERELVQMSKETWLERLLSTYVRIVIGAVMILILNNYMSQIYILYI